VFEEIARRKELAPRQADDGPIRVGHAGYPLSQLPEDVRADGLDGGI
jgi:hypothetical protein